ncbi:MAG: HPr family phosphocarrier protein [Lachnospiraceae bacterium]|nr:HPr family phosphocarrier protein [Lachnospiraceae bacterium]
MNEKQIKLQSRQEVQDFVQAAGKCNFDIDISYDRIVIDAKSFLGVLGLGVSRVLKVTYCGMNNEFEDTVQKYQVA